MYQQLIPGVNLAVDSFGLATLSINGVEINFAWTTDAEAVFNDLDTCEPIELLAVLTQTISNQQYIA